MSAGTTIKKNLKISKSTNSKHKRVLAVVDFFNGSAHSPCILLNHTANTFSCITSFDKIRKNAMKLMIISLSAPSCANTVEVCDVDVVYVKLVASQPGSS
jgi:hypothetical protein